MERSAHLNAYLKVETVGIEFGFNVIPNLLKIKGLNQSHISH